MNVSVAEAESKLPELLEMVETGETVTICRDGLPVAEIVQAKPPAKKGAPKFGTLNGKITIHDPDWWKPMSERSRGGRLHQREVLSAVSARHRHLPLCRAISVPDLRPCRPVAGR
jgi:antitoxin (DNA-binding transcriptional repressor) of toxin-antitoxin stability system